MVEATQGDGVNRPVIYARWREDKEAQPGHTRELISVDTPKEFWDNHNGMPKAVPEAVTFLDYFERNCKLYGNDPFLGTRQVTHKDENGKEVFGEYQW